MSTRVAPIFPVSDLAAALAYYRGLGFTTRQWHGVLVDPDGNLIRFGSPVNAD